MRNILQIRQNYWFWPGLLTLAGLVLGLVMPLVDARVGDNWIRNHDILTIVESSGARGILTTLASAVLGVAGVSYSITIVAVSFASGNFGPRLVGNFMRDRLNQTVLGIFLGSFVYMIVVLRTVYDGTDGTAAFVPQISLLLALAFTLISVCALIVFFHHVPESIDIMNLASEIGHGLRASVIELLENEDERVSIRKDQPLSQPIKGVPSLALIRSDADGYMQSLDIDALKGVAEKYDVYLRVLRGPGEFVATHDAVFEMRGEGDATDAPTAALRCISLGASRNGDQDTLFYIDQIVEMVGRALSPSMNDPYTAIICLDWLRAGLSEFVRRPPFEPDDPWDRVVYQRVTFEQMLDRAYGRMRQYLAADRAATLHALTGLADLACAACNEARADRVRDLMRDLGNAADETLETSTARQDVADLLARELTRISESRAGVPDTPAPAD
ncbi:DUF2254 domain-containing protein [Acuticoccus sp. MNP-M23]|uniref:DUF2254 domain-containing protein n=1 Tax=Acuticoccus sp. MNP-M23 TaxID=3072793 RepID=UPI0028150905|nr:DUF2254 domain-containing protein [Acuticoccus sp. MNP-M23]WMS44806.1 DUF2254 domain-containing protein [Acuticoccus sp. MNP-M23]